MGIEIVTTSYSKAYSKALLDEKDLTAKAFFLGFQGHLSTSNGLPIFDGSLNRNCPEGKLLEEGSQPSKSDLNEDLEKFSEPSPQRQSKSLPLGP